MDAVAPDFWSDLARRATTLQERLAARLEGKPADGECERLLEQWRDAISPGDWRGLDLRLSWVGRARSEGLASLFAPPTQGFELLAAPAWLTTFEAVSERVACVFSAGAPARSVILELEDPVPFEDLLAPVVDHAFDALRARLDAPPARLSMRVAPAAERELARGLLVELSRIVSPVLLAELRAQRSFGSNLLSKIGTRSESSGSRERYATFVTRHGHDGMRSLAGAYPMLARMLATRVDTWVDGAEEVVRRLERDWEGLIARLAPGTSPSERVVSIRGGLSDPHGGGRSVLILQLESGGRIVYKPRDPGLHVAFGEFLEWFDAASGIHLESAAIWPRDGYGWAGFVEPRGCADAGEARLFYEHAGALLCVIHFLGGTDCHSENFVAVGDQMLLIDVETLLHPDLALGASESDGDGAEEPDPILDSVLRTGMLPRWKFTPDREAAYDISGLGSHDVPAVLSRKMRWLAVNTDDMHLAVVEGDPPPRRNVPTLAGPRLCVASYVGDLLRGFEQAWRAIQDRRVELLSPGGPLDVFLHSPTRFVFRPTKVYVSILDWSLSPAACRDGAAWGLGMESLARALVLVEEMHGLAPLLVAETEALTQLDVPCFTASADSPDLRPLGREPLAGVSTLVGLDAARRRIELASDESLALQLEVIRGSCAALAAGSSRAGAPQAQAESELDDGADELSSDELIEEARRIGEHLAERAMEDRQGRVRWLGFGFAAASERLQVGLVPHGLYDGRCGIALFLATLDAVRGETERRDLWHAAMEPFRELEDPASIERHRFLRSGIGLATGFAGVAYTMLRLRRLLPESDPRERGEWLERAARVAHLIDARAVEQDTALDLLGGSAGAILSLLELHAETGEPEWLDAARRCGAHLAEGQRALLERAPEQPPLTGFSHGGSGVAYALASLHALTGEAWLDQTARASLDYEAGLYDAKRRNWPDLRWERTPGEPPAFQTSWCHGAPGIALARAALLEARDDAALRADWEAGISHTAGIELLPVDTICCGNLGLCDVLLTSAQLLGRSDLRAHAERRAARVVRRAREGGGYRLFAAIPEPVFNPGLFQGLAGVGYQLLRLARPERVPSVLLFRA